MCAGPKRRKPASTRGLGSISQKMAGLHTSHLTLQLVGFPPLVMSSGTVELSVFSAGQRNSKGPPLMQSVLKHEAKQEELEGTTGHADWFTRYKELGPMQGTIFLQPVSATKGSHSASTLQLEETVPV
mmetsp:Transcript_47366/g.98281  ORF Transcript_47366/g.98281 Transcript_47366/m.98281 type:complete len:128 (+) Transcript_47366:445-828(+)